MLETAFNFFGAAISWLEVVAFILALANVVCSVRESHWAWPLAIVSSALYVWLFLVSKLYGETGVNVFFVLSAVWGWWQWLFGHRRGETAPLAPVRMQPSRGWMLALSAWAVLWAAVGLFLRSVTDSDVPWADAFVTSGSIVGTVLLARKYIENWPIWLVVNAASIALFVYKSLLLTTLLYAILLGLTLWGWRVWHLRVTARAVKP
jgi:nicotinamide mononucleotide transporter